MMEFIQYGVRFMLIVLFTFFLSLFVTSAFTVSVPVFETNSRVFFTQIVAQTQAQYANTGVVNLDLIQLPYGLSTTGRLKSIFGAKISYASTVQSSEYDETDENDFSVYQQRFFQKDLYDIYCSISSTISEKLYVKRTFVQPIGPSLLVVTVCGLGDFTDE
jgi:hypothetical protein